MKSVFLTLIAASCIFGFVNPQELNHSNADDFTILEKPAHGL